MLKNRVFYPLLAITILILGFALSKMATRTPPEVRKIYRVTTPDAETSSSPNIEVQSESVTDMTPMDIVGIENLIDGNKNFLEILKSLKGYNKSWVEVMDPNLPRTHPFNVEARHKASFAKFINGSTPEQLADPTFQKIIEVHFSESYLNLLNGGANSDELSNFVIGELGKFTGTDVSDIRNPGQRYFRQYFPTGTHEDHEPEMRDRLTALIQKNGGYSSEVLSEFMRDKRAGIWYYTRGLKYDSQRDIDSSVNVDWVKEIRANTMGLTEAESMDLDVEVPIPNTLPLSEFDTTETTSTQQAPSENPVLNFLNAAKDDPDINSELTPPSSLPRPRPMPSASQLLATDAEVEVSLREHFSPQRFNNAILTLDQYGPEEGIRRIKRSDPEVAKHIERLIQPKPEQIGEK